MRLHLRVVFSLSNKESLGWQGFDSLECKGLRGNLIEMYKIMKEIDRVNAHSVFPSMGGINN